MRSLWRLRTPWHRRLAELGALIPSEVIDLPATESAVRVFIVGFDQLNVSDVVFGNDFHCVRSGSNLWQGQSFGARTCRNMEAAVLDKFA